MLAYNLVLMTKIFRSFTTIHFDMWSFECKNSCLKYFFLFMDGFSFSIVTCIWYIKKYEKYEVLESFQIYKHKVKNQLGHSMIFFYLIIMDKQISELSDNFLN